MWGSNQTYSAGDNIVYQNKYYVAKRDVSQNTPPTSSSDWFWLEVSSCEGNLPSEEHSRSQVFKEEVTFEKKVTVEDGADIVIKGRENGIRINEGSTVSSTYNQSGISFTNGAVKTEVTANSVTTKNLTTTGDVKVCGLLQAKEVEVTLDIVPDYVFKEGYQLKSIDELEAHIKEKKHLPGVPSEKNIAENGSKIKLSAFNAALLEKIEELSLYVIQLHKKNQELEKQIKALKK